MDFLLLINELAKKAAPVTADDKVPLTDMNQPLTDSGMDSMDLLMVSIYLCEFYGIDEETSKTMPMDTPQNVYDWLMKHKTKDVEDVDAALESIQ